MKKRLLICFVCLLLLVQLPLTALAENEPERLTMEQLELWAYTACAATALEPMTF